MAAPVITSFFVGFCVRVWLFGTSVADWLTDRNEISTPVTSWKRLTEGMSLLQNKIDPYSGDIFHETPIMLHFMNYVNLKWQRLEPLLFVFTDIFIALVLERITKYAILYLAYQNKLKHKAYAKGTEAIQIDEKRMQKIRIYVILGYLLNPYTIATCLAKSTAIFNNLAITVAIFYLFKGNRTMCTFFLALAAYLSFYPAMLIVPVTLYFVQMREKGRRWSRRETLASVCSTVLLFCFWSGILLLYSSWITGSWSFLGSTYGFVLSVPDLTPNVGLFWYFFTEMFEHFRVFFLCVFQINAFVHTVPLAIRLRDQPVFMLYVLLMLMSVFKSYPSYADTTIYLALLPVWSFTFYNLRNSFIIACMFVCSTVFGPIMYHLWIYAGSANANFYFAITLVYSTAQIFLITDVLHAFLRWDFDLHHGLTIEVNGKKATVLLKD